MSNIIFQKSQHKRWTPRHYKWFNKRMKWTSHPIDLIHAERVPCFFAFSDLPSTILAKLNSATSFLASITLYIYNSLGKPIDSYWFKISCLSCLIFICAHCFFLKMMKLYKDICSAWISRTSAEIFFSQIDVINVSKIQ